MAAGNLELVTDAVAVRVVQASAVTVVTILSVLARVVAVGSIRVVVASGLVLAARNLELVTDAVAVRVV